MNDLAGLPYQIVPATDELWDDLGFPGDRPSAKPRFTLEPLSSIDTVMNGSWIIKDLLPTSGLAVLYGEPGCGKSFVALDAALHVASGRSWAGKTVTQGGVVYICAEGESGFRKRVVAARRNLDLPSDTPFALISTAPNLGPVNGDAGDLIDCIREQTKVFGWTPRLVVIDTLARSMVGVDESNARDMGGFIDNAGRIERELGVLVLAVHHTGKDLERGMRGSSALHGATSAEWEIGGDKASRVIRIAKMKDGDNDQSIMFRMFPTEVGVDEDGDPVTTLLVETSDVEKHGETLKSKPRKPLIGQRAQVFKAVTMAVDEMGAVPPNDNHIPAKVKCVTRQQLERYADNLVFLSGMSEKTKQTTLDRHIRTLAGDGYVGRWREFLWLA